MGIITCSFWHFVVEYHLVVARFGAIFKEVFSAVSGPMRMVGHEVSKQVRNLSLVKVVYN